MLSETHLSNIEIFLQGDKDKNLYDALWPTEDVDALVKEVRRLQQRCAVCKHNEWDGWWGVDICTALYPQPHDIAPGGLCDIEKFEEAKPDA